MAEEPDVEGIEQELDEGIEQELDEATRYIIIITQDPTDQSLTYDIQGWTGTEADSLDEWSDED